MSNPRAISVFVLLLCQPIVLNAQLDSVSQSQGHRLRPQAGIAVLATFGTSSGLLGLVAKCNAAPHWVLEAGVGYIPAFFRDEILICTVGTNFHFSENRLASPYVNLNIAYLPTFRNGRKVTEDYTVNPMIGVDFLSKSGINCFLRGGAGWYIVRKMRSVFSFRFDIGLGYAFY